jgi:hypothetical protein
MSDPVFQAHHLRTTVLDLINGGQRSLAWSMIDHYIKKAHTLEHFDVLGHISLKADKRDTYLECAEAAYAMAIQPHQRLAARTNLYMAYNAMNQPEKALFYIEENLKLMPDHFETLCQKAFNTSLLGHKEIAEQMLLDLTIKYPESAHKIQAAFSGKHLREGRTAEGILSFIEAFKPRNRLFEDQMGMKRWSGLITPGKTLYVDSEGGIGDEIINIRFFDRIKSYGMIPILVSDNSSYHKHINQVFTRHGYEVLIDKFSIDRTQVWAPMMSIPGYMNLSEDQLWTGPYFKPLRNPKNKLEGTRPRIGIKCSGNPFFAQDEYRKIPLQEMLSCLPKDADIYYIDKEVGHQGTIDLGDRIESWDDTLDFIDQMDCIVSSCTSLVHAAGAMGKQTFVAVPIAEYYIWTTTKRDGTSPWYGDSFYVARQTKVRDWSEPLADIGQRVNKFLWSK